MSISPTRLMRTSHGMVSLGLGSGLAPVAPGTAGSALAALLAYPLMMQAWWLQLTAIVLCFLVGWWASHQSGIALGKTDHGAIVIDEFAGMWITLFLVFPDPKTWLLGFLLFRLFDIFKPWPVRWAEQRFRGGLGVMLDDVLAGIYAALTLHLILLLWGSWP